MLDPMVPRIGQTSLRMGKLDRLGWAAGVSVYAWGLRIGIRTNRPEIMDRIPKVLPPGCEPGISPLVDFLYSLVVRGTARGPQVRHNYLLYNGSNRLTRTSDLDEAIRELEGDLQLCVATWARNHLFVHAGVVGWRGKAIVLPGRSWAGKSSLTAALLRAGAVYYSDEFAVLDSRGHVHPFARPLALREVIGSSPILVTNRRCQLEQLTSEVGQTPLPVSLVAFAKYQKGGVWQPRQLRPSQAVLELMDHVIVPPEREPDMILSTLQKVVTRAPVLKGPRGEADEAAAALLAVVEKTEPLACSGSRTRFISDN